jgi:hypothetical protein
MVPEAGSLGAPFVLIHSPLIWARVAEELRVRGFDASTPTLVQHEGSAEP